MPPQDPGVAAIVSDHAVDTPLSLLEVKELEQIRTFVRDLYQRGKDDARTSATNTGLG
jgi:hypothetical protein